MTQRAHKGKLYQLQYQIDLSYFILSHIPRIWLLQLFDSTKLIYFANTSHKADGPVGTHRFAKQTPLSTWRGTPEGRGEVKTLTTAHPNNECSFFEVLLRAVTLMKNMDFPAFTIPLF